MTTPDHTTELVTVTLTPRQPRVTTEAEEARDRARDVEDQRQTERTHRAVRPRA